MHSFVPARKRNEAHSGRATHSAKHAPRASFSGDGSTASVSSEGTHGRSADPEVHSIAHSRAPRTTETRPHKHTKTTRNARVDVSQSMISSRAKFVFVDRVDHERWVAASAPGKPTIVVRLPGETDLLLHGAEYDVEVSASPGAAWAEGRVRGARKLPWSEELRRALVGPTLVRAATPEAIVAHPNIVPARKLEVQKWLAFEPPAYALESPLAAALRLSNGDMFSSAVAEAVCIDEISEAMKRTGRVWIESRASRNLRVVNDRSAYDALLDRGVLVRREIDGLGHVAFAWAAQQLDTVPADAVFFDDCDVAPSADLSLRACDMFARTDAFVDARVVCTSMAARERRVEPRAPWTKPPPKEEHAAVPRHRLAEWAKRAESEASLFVGESADIACCGTLDPSGAAVLARPNLARPDLVTINNKSNVYCASARTDLRSVCVRGFADLLLRVPRDAKFKCAYVAVDLGTDPKWIREACRFAPSYVLIHVI